MVADNDIYRLADAFNESLLARGVKKTNYTQLISDNGISKSQLKNFFPNKESFVLYCVKRYDSQLKSKLLGAIKETNIPLDNLRFFMGRLYTHCQKELVCFPIFDAYQYYQRPRLDYYDKQDMSRAEIDDYYGFQKEFTEIKLNFEKFITNTIKDLVTAYVSDVKGRHSTSPTYSKLISDSLLEELSLSKNDQVRDFATTVAHLNTLKERLNKQLVSNDTESVDNEV